jgi:predicted small metal-binding protein
MTYEIQCEQDLGIQGCDFVARGDVAGDVVDQVVTHVRRAHNVKMPDADEIMRGEPSANPLAPGMDKGASTVVRRLREALNLEPDGSPTPDSRL